MITNLCDQSSRVWRVQLAALSDLMPRPYTTYSMLFHCDIEYFKLDYEEAYDVLTEDEHLLYRSSLG